MFGRDGAGQLALFGLREAKRKKIARAEVRQVEHLAEATVAVDDEELSIQSADADRQRIGPGFPAIDAG